MIRKPKVGKTYWWKSSPYSPFAYPVVVLAWPSSMASDEAEVRFERCGVGRVLTVNLYTERQILKLQLLRAAGHAV